MLTVIVPVLKFIVMHIKTLVYIFLKIIAIDCFCQTLYENDTTFRPIKGYNGENDLPNGLINKTEEYSINTIKWITLNQKEYIGDYLKIDNKVYCGSIRCYTTPLNIDIATFQVLSLTPYSRDKKNVYCYNTLTCEDCDDCCGGCWCDMFIVEKAHPATFRYISNSYATDGRNVYYHGLLIQVADSKTFKVINTPKDFSFAVDKNHVYKGSEVFKDAEPSTFYYDKSNSKNDLILIIGDRNNKWEYDISKNSILILDKK